MQTKDVHRISSSVPLRDRFGCTVKEACTATGLKPTKLYELIAAGAIESTKIDRRRIIVVRSLQRLIEGDASERPQTPEAA
jgi:excisionase family DNA binding protein